MRPPDRPARPPSLRGAPPFFEAAGAAPAGSRRLLLLSHSFAPSRLVGALRWTRALPILSSERMVFDVICAQPPASIATERALLETLPGGTRVFTVPAPGPGPWRHALSLLVATARATRALRRPAPSSDGRGAAVAGAALPPVRPFTRESLVLGLLFRANDEDEDGWARQAIAVARAQLNPSDYAAVVTSGPPHAIHFRAAQYAREAALPHCMDLRDPWSHLSWTDGFRRSPLFVRTLRPRQVDVMRDVALVTATTERHADIVRANYPHAASRVFAVRNGADAVAIPDAVDDGVFRITYTGELYVDRHPLALFRAARAFADAERLGPDRLRVEFMGAVEMIGKERVADLGARAGLTDWLTLTPPRPRTEAMALLSRSHVLVSFAEQLRETIPAKVFEYARFPAWMLLIGPEDGAAHDLLSGSGMLSAPAQDVPRIHAQLAHAYHEWRSRGRPRPIVEMVDLSRATQVARLAELLKDVIAARQ